MSRLIDTHTHLYFDDFQEDFEATLQRAHEANITDMILPAVDLPTSNQIVELIDQHTSLWGAVGFHPNSSFAFKPNDLDELRKLSQHRKVIAIGEIGLDYYWDKSPKETQHTVFVKQLELAAELELPVIIHNREASEDTLTILEAWVEALPASLKTRPGVLHSFSAPADIAERALNAGFYLGFTGPITYKNADELRHIASNVPLDRILVETDAPFLTPTPYRGKRNESAYVRLVAERLATLKQMSLDALAQATTENTLRLFQLEH